MAPGRFPVPSARQPDRTSTVTEGEPRAPLFHSTEPSSNRHQCFRPNGVESLRAIQRIGNHLTSGSQPRTARHALLCRGLDDTGFPPRKFSEVSRIHGIDGLGPHRVTANCSRTTPVSQTRIARVVAERHPVGSELDVCNAAARRPARRRPDNHSGPAMRRVGNSPSPHSSPDRGGQNNLHESGPLVLLALHILSAPNLRRNQILPSCPIAP
jgi:hypothetical protein